MRRRGVCRTIVAMKPTLILAAATVASALALAIPATAQDTQSSSVKETIKDDAKTAGHAIADGARTVGHAVADTSRKVGNDVAEKTAPARDKIRDDSKKAGTAIAHGAKTVGTSVKNGAEKAKAAVTPKSDAPQPASEPKPGS